MLTTTFLHLPGIGKVTQNRLQEAGINTWAEASAACSSSSLPLPAKHLGLFPIALAESEERLKNNDALWFSERLASAECWRLYPHFYHSAAYVDIETTGLGAGRDYITSIALYDGNTVRSYVHGRNLEDFCIDIKPYDLLITWNGRSFDAPFIRRELKIDLAVAHLDLLPVFRALDLRGGLKSVEKQLGLEREALHGMEVDGWTAVLLWNEFKHTGNEKALETLLAYNIEDVLSLEYLSRYACKRHGCLIPEKESPPVKNLYTADLDILQKIQSRRSNIYSRR